jgi:hypothetical protein
MPARPKVELMMPTAARSSDAQENHPAEGDHGREVEGGYTGEHAERLAVAHGVVPGEHVHEGFALG